MIESYPTYLLLNKPKQLTQQQVDYIKKQNDGSPISEEFIEVNSDKVFLKNMKIRENDICLLNLIRL
jgi:xylan 1,4-beta-xylosidase